MKKTIFEALEIKITFFEEDLVRTSENYDDVGAWDEGWGGKN